MTPGPKFSSRTSTCRTSPDEQLPPALVLEVERDGLLVGVEQSERHRRRRWILPAAGRLAARLLDLHDSRSGQREQRSAPRALVDAARDPGLRRLRAEAVERPSAPEELEGCASRGAPACPPRVFATAGAIDQLVDVAVRNTGTYGRGTNQRDLDRSERERRIGGHSGQSSAGRLGRPHRPERRGQ